MYRVVPVNILLSDQFVDLIAVLKYPAFVVRTFTKIANSVTVLRSSHRHLMRYTRVIRYALSIHSTGNRAAVFKLFNGHILRCRRKDSLRHSTSNVKGIMTFSTR